MKAQELYVKIGRDFDIDKYTDDWSFVEFNEFINPDFQERYIGVMLDILLFCHHAMGYDPTLEGFPFYNIPVGYLKKLKERRISFYVMHIPLDINGTYSTSVNLAKELQLQITGELCEYLGCKVGVICETDFMKLRDFALYVENIIGHAIKVRQYGDEIIQRKTVAVAAGGGCIDFVARELAALGINTFLTGCTRPIRSFKPNMEFHRIARKNKINLVGATHYSTEKFACMAMAKYFAELGIRAEFIDGTPSVEDL
jgi:putative NIF3 family GTP cyclohydrolase 1 type 2